MSKTIEHLQSAPRFKVDSLGHGEAWAIEVCESMGTSTLPPNYTGVSCLQHKNISKFPFLEPISYFTVNSVSRPSSLAVLFSWLHHLHKKNKTSLENLKMFKETIGPVVGFTKQGNL